MTLSPELSTGLALVALALSVVCFIGCYAAVMFAARLARERRDYGEILRQIFELDDRLCALNDSHKRLRSRVGMRELRARRKQEHNGPDTEPETTDEARQREEWKRQMRVKLHRGEIKP